MPACTNCINAAYLCSRGRCRSSRFARWPRNTIFCGVRWKAWPLSCNHFAARVLHRRTSVTGDARRRDHGRRVLQSFVNHARRALPRHIEPRGRRHRGRAPAMAREQDRFTPGRLLKQSLLHAVFFTSFSPHIPTVPPAWLLMSSCKMTDSATWRESWLNIGG
eukprot:6021506-Pleurochrysis_carterae.AAC.1